MYQCFWHFTHWIREFDVPEWPTSILCPSLSDCNDGPRQLTTGYHQARILSRNNEYVNKQQDAHRTLLLLPSSFAFECRRFPSSLPVTCLPACLFVQAAWSLRSGFMRSYKNRPSPEPCASTDVAGCPKRKLTASKGMQPMERIKCCTMCGPFLLSLCCTHVADCGRPQQISCLCAVSSLYCLNA